jgi:glycine C-acetyltransferase
MSSTAPNPLFFLHDQLEELEAKGQHFRLRVLDGEQKPVAQFDGREVINLSSNNYLGLTTHKALRRAAIEAIRTHGVGAGAVRTIAGTMDLHMALEEQIAKFKGTEAAVVFQSGFTANAGTVAAILGRLRTPLQGNRELAGAETPDYRRRVFYGGRHRPAARAVRPRGKI